jgi:dCMP deaminase
VEDRPSWDEYFMEITHLVAKRSTCLRRIVGAVLVRDKKILTTGYNGAPSGLEHCLGLGCIRSELNIPSSEKHELCRGIHAEQNVIIQAAYHGVSINGATLYVTTFPCSICAKMIINAGIVKVIYDSGYDDNLSKKMLKEAGIELKILKTTKGEKGK